MGGRRGRTGRVGGRARERRTALRIMAGFGDGYVGTSTDAAVGQALLKNREKMFATSEAEKAKLREETAAYRLRRIG